MQLFSDEYFMNMAFKEAEQAYHEGEIPIGAVIVCNNKIIGKGHNLTEKLNDVTAHAEMQAITAAANFLGSKYLVDCTMYVTLEPCTMCAGALYWSQISKLVYGASDFKRGYTKHKIALHPTTEVVSGIFSEESEKLLKKFFKELRER